MAPTKRRLRTLDQIENERKHSLKLMREFTELKVPSILKTRVPDDKSIVPDAKRVSFQLDSNAVDKVPMSKQEKLTRRILNYDTKEPFPRATKLALKMRKKGPMLDNRLAMGDVRDVNNTHHNSNMLVYQVMIRSIGDTFEECVKEWIPNEDVGIKGWFCVNGKQDDVDGRKMWLDDPTDESWEPGQCACLLHRGYNYPKKSQMIKFRYSIRNIYTGHTLVVGSTCINKFGPIFSNVAKDTYHYAVKPVARERSAKKWLFI